MFGGNCLGGFATCSWLENDCWKKTSIQHGQNYIAYWKKEGRKNKSIISNAPILPSTNKDNFFLDTKKKYYMLQLHCVVLFCAKSFQSCLTLWDPIDCSPPGSSVQGILQARLLEWVSKSSSRRSSWSRNRTHLSRISCIGRQILYHWATWEDPSYIIKEQIKDQIWNRVNLLIIGTIYTGDGNDNPLQYSCLENPLDEPGGLQSMGLQSGTWLSDFTFTF